MALGLPLLRIWAEQLQMNTDFHRVVNMPLRGDRKHENAPRRSRAGGGSRTRRERSSRLKFLHYFSTAPT